MTFKTARLQNAIKLQQTRALLILCHLFLFFFLFAVHDYFNVLFSVHVLLSFVLSLGGFCIFFPLGGRGSWSLCSYSALIISKPV